MTDPGELAKRDQEIAAAIDMMPRMWWTLFTQLKAEGFDTEQSMRLVIATIHTSTNK